MSLCFPEPPSFVQIPSPVESDRGKDACLHCEMQGTPPFQVSWYKNKHLIREGRKYKVVTESRFTTLHILKMEQDDAGEYECRVSNSAGSESCRTTIALKGQYKTRIPVDLAPSWDLMSNLSVNVQIPPHLSRHCWTSR